MIKYEIKEVFHCNFKLYYNDKMSMIAPNNAELQFWFERNAAQHDLDRLKEAANQYMRQPDLSHYASLEAWEFDSDLRGQALLDILDELEEKT